MQSDPTVATNPMQSDPPVAGNPIQSYPAINPSNYGGPGIGKSLELLLAAWELAYR